MASKRRMPATFKRPPKPGAMRGLQGAMAALYAPVAGLTPESMLAECEQRRRESDAAQRPQGELRLR